MHPIFSASAKEIQQLSDAQSRELVARLCRAEMRALNVSEVAVTWGGDQRAKDGGVDVRVDIAPPRGISGYVKRDFTAFQVKAEKFGPSKISGEIAPKGVVRPAIKELESVCGAYIIVSTRDDVADSGLSARVAAMKKGLLTFGIGDQVSVDFYDCRRVADWVEQHPSVCVWVKAQLGKALVGWRPYGPWAYQEQSVEPEYILDEEVKLVPPSSDRALPALAAISCLRAELSSPRSVRLVGLSGVGKTRFVQALFDERIKTEAPALACDNVLYTDLSFAPEPLPTAMIEALLAENSDCVVVIDNCGAEPHRILTELVRQPGKRLRLITIEYDIRDDLLEGTLVYRMERSSNELIRRLLKAKYRVLSENDIEQIATFSDGNARVALALASTTETTGELGRLRDAELFERLFYQKGGKDAELLRCAEVASLLYSFDITNVRAGGELHKLASLADVSAVAFVRNVTELQRRGLVQARTDWRAVLPHAIANFLAKRALEALAPLVERSMMNSQARTARSFSRRLGFLHESAEARTLVSSWLKANGRYGDLIQLGDDGITIFGNVSPVCPEAALDAIARAADDPKFALMNSGRRTELARVVRLIAFEPVYFDRAIDILAKFAHVESGESRSDSSTDMLTSLFAFVFSGTRALPFQRARKLDELLSSKEDATSSLGLSGLRVALEGSHFSSHYSFDFGARKRDYGWMPKDRDEELEWFRCFLRLAVKCTKDSSRLGSKAKKILGNSLRGLWHLGLRAEIEAAAHELVVIDGWPDGWLGVKEILYYDEVGEEADALNRLRELEILLLPKGLASEIIAKIFTSDNFSVAIYGRGFDAAAISTSFAEAERDAIALGTKAACELEVLNEIIPAALRAEGSQGSHNFGRGLGRACSEPDKIVEIVRSELTSSAPGAVNLIFFRGFLSGWNEANPSAVEAFLDSALVDSIWQQWFPELQVQVPINKAGFERLCVSLVNQVAPLWQYRYLGFGRATDPLTVVEAMTLVIAIAESSEEDMEVAIGVLVMLVHRAQEKDEQYNSELAAGCINFVGRFDWEITLSINRDHELLTILEFALQRVPRVDALDALARMVEAARGGSGVSARRFSAVLKPFASLYPIELLDALYVADTDGDYRTAKSLLARSALFEQGSLIDTVPTAALLSWCQSSPEDRFKFAAESCCIFRAHNSERGEGAGKVGLSEIVIDIMKYAPNKSAIFDIVIGRFFPRSWSGSLANVLERRLPLIAGLNPSNQPDLTVRIARAEADLKKMIQLARTREEESERGRTATFE